MEENLWLIELESVLLDDCNVNDIYAICQGKALPETLRPDVWQVCLDVRHKNDQMCHFNEIYDLPFQNQLRNDCQDEVEKIGNDDEDKVSVLSDLESILTFYCKNRNLQYETDNGWIKLLLPILALKVNRSDTYNLFEAIRDTYIPKGCVPKGNVFHVFRLLLLYHDPELCTMLDTKKISPDLYSMQWFQTLFASSCGLSVILCMWDFYFQHADPFLVFFLSLIILINGREQILKLKDSSKEEIINFLSNMPCALDTDDVVDFCTLAQYYAIKTPSSFKTDFLKALYGNAQNEKGQLLKNESCLAAQVLCLPVSVYELVENSSQEASSTDTLRFFLVDCRPAEQYNGGHLPTAFHLDCNLMLQEPQAFATAVQGLLNAQRQAIEANSNAGGEHLCFMSSGRMEEDQYTHMVVASFLQKNTQYVSMLSGGYKAVHDYFGEHMADCLEDHHSTKCIVCSENVVELRSKHTNVSQQRNSSSDVLSGNKLNRESKTSEFFNRFSNVMKIKSAEVKEKLFDIIANPNQNASPPALAKEKPDPPRHALPVDRSNSRRYRNQPSVFSIDDENDDSYDDAGVRDSPEHAATKLQDNQKEVVNTNSYLKSADIVNTFKCQEVHLNGKMYDSHLIITNSHLIVLREMDRGQSQVVVRRPLTSIVKITAKKRHRDLITFKYGFPDGDNLVITDMDRFLIPNASEATATVSKHIVETLDGAKLI